MLVNILHDPEARVAGLGLIAERLEAVLAKPRLPPRPTIRTRTRSSAGKTCVHPSRLVEAWPSGPISRTRTAPRMTRPERR